jgi:DGQHR domain-containing protein
MDKGADLNRRVWNIFQKAGFETKPNSADPSEHVIELPGGARRPVDLYARAANLNVTIIGSNKARKKLQSYTTHIHDLERLKITAQANCALFIAAEKEMQRAERNFAQQTGVHVWDERQLSYYEALAEALGPYAKYEIIHALGISTEEETLKDTVLGIRLHQPRPGATNNTELYMFTLPAEKLLKTCVVLRKAQGSAFAYQRILSRKRLPKIGVFVGTPEALIPTNVVVHLGESFTIDEIKGMHDGELKDTRGNTVTPSRKDHQLVSLTFPLKYGSLELIDGQHRLFGFIHADPATRNSFNLVVLGIRKLDERRRSQVFVGINDNARRVDPNLVAYLRYTSDERTCQNNPDLMAIKIVVELNKLSPFKDSIRLFDVGRQRLTLKGLSGYDLKGLIGPKGHLRSYCKRNSSEQYIRALRIYFSTVREHFPEEWNDPRKYIIATNRGITAFLKLLRSILKSDQKPLTRRTAKKYIGSLRHNWTGGWETANLKKSYVGSQGWKQFHHDMVESIRKRYKSFQE